MFVCPFCKKKLFKDTDENKYLKCLNKECNLKYNTFPIINKKPILIPYGKDYCIFKKPNLEGKVNLGSKRRTSLSEENQFNRFLKKLFKGENKKSIDNYIFLSKNISKSSRILIIGGGTIGEGSDRFFEKCIKESINFESIDVYFSENITAIADAHYLPYQDKIFDLVIIQAVLEHVINPQKVISEIYRVLGKNGLVYAETPFLQSVHEGPYDFTRFTFSGHRYLFRSFEEIKSGVIQGAFSSTLFVASYSIAALFKNNKIGIILRAIFNRAAKFLDSLIDHKWNSDIACGFYFIGEKKNKQSIEDGSSWIAEYYKGAQK